MPFSNSMLFHSTSSLQRVLLVPMSLSSRLYVCSVVGLGSQCCSLSFLSSCWSFTSRSLPLIHPTGTAASHPKRITCSSGTTSTAESSRWKPFACCWPTKSNTPKTSSSCAATTSARPSTVFMGSTTNASAGTRTEREKGEGAGSSLLRYAERALVLF